MYCRLLFHDGQKTQGQKNSSPEKTQAIFSQKNQGTRGYFGNLPTKTPKTPKLKITVTSAKFWPKSQKIPLISEKTQANPKKTQGVWLKTQCTRGKSLLHPLTKREHKKPVLSVFTGRTCYLSKSLDCSNNIHQKLVLMLTNLAYLKLAKSPSIPFFFVRYLFFVKYHYKINSCAFLLVRFAGYSNVTYLPMHIVVGWI